MKRFIAAALCMALMVSVLCACADNENFTDGDNLTSKYTRSSEAEEYNYSDSTVSAPADYATFSNEIADFTFRIFRNYNTAFGADGSYVFSPACSALQLGLIANGASEDTEDEILRAMCKDLDTQSLNQCFLYFKSRLESVGEKSANGEKNYFADIDANLFVNDTADIKSKFIQTDTDYYGCDLFRFMFDDSNALTKINNQFSDFGVQNAFSSIDKEQTMFSATAAGVCDLWLNAYAKNNLEKGKFGSEDATYMVSDETYMHTSNAKAVMKYMSKTPLKFMAIIPNEGVSLDDYIADFTNAEFSKLLASVDFSKRATAKIPEFFIKSDGKAKNITDVMKQSGLFSLFSDKARFGGLTRSNGFMFDAMYEIMPDLSVSSGGIETTSVTMNNLPLGEKKEYNSDVTVEFDRPFIFLILDNESNIPLYIGTVRTVNK